MTPTQFSPSTSEVQGLLNDVNLDGELARGGQKVVFSARSEKFGKVAVKLILKSPNSGARAERELSIARALDDPHFPKIYDSKVIVLGGQEIICVYEEFVEGMSLRDLLSDLSQLDVQRVLRLAIEILTALQTLHVRDTVHRDIKPENIYLANDGKVLLLDLGIARQLGETSITADHAMFGPLTPGYGAPEQIRNEKRKISTRTDLFALGVVLYECLTGNNPFVPHGASAAEAAQNTLILDPAPLDESIFPKALCRAIHRSLQKSPHRRFASPSDMLRQIEPLLQEDR